MHSQRTTRSNKHQVTIRMQELEAKFQEKEIIYIPIHKLHGIPVCVRIQQKDLLIESFTFYDVDCDNIELYRGGVTSVKDAVDTIKILKLHNQVGKFVKEMPFPVSDWAEMFADCKHIEMVGDMCCVCHADYIYSKTGCGHTICISCVHQIEPVERRGSCSSDASEIPCPMCREDITNNWNV